MSSEYEWQTCHIPEWTSLHLVSVWNCRTRSPSCDFTANSLSCSRLYRRWFGDSSYRLVSHGFFNLKIIERLFSRKVALGGSHALEAGPVLNPWKRALLSGCPRYLVSESQCALVCIIPWLRGHCGQVKSVWRTCQIGCLKPVGNIESDEIYVYY